jgi:hypothetical protein
MYLYISYVKIEDILDRNKILSNLCETIKPIGLLSCKFGFTDNFETLLFGGPFYRVYTVIISGHLYQLSDMCWFKIYFQ